MDIHNRKLRGEDVPEEAYQEQALDDDFDIVESADADALAVGAEAEEGYADADPDVTAETAVPPVHYGGDDQSGSGEHAEGGYDSGAVPGQPTEGMTSDQYSSGQQQQEGYEQVPEQQQQQGYEQVPEQQQEGYEQVPEQQPEVNPDDQDPNRQQ